MIPSNFRAILAFMFILIAVLALTCLILLHELGHFLVARLCGMQVDVFSIGFGPTLYKKKVGSTVYKISMIPLGGYVQIAGLSDDEETQQSLDPSSPHLYPNRPIWQRMLTVFAGPAMNYLISFFLIFTSFMLIKQPTHPGEINQVVQGMPAFKAGIQPGDQIISINGVFINSFQQIADATKNSNGHVLKVSVRSSNNIIRNLEIQPIFYNNQWIIGTSRITCNTVCAIQQAVILPMYISLQTLKALVTTSAKKLLGQDLVSPIKMVGLMSKELKLGWSKAIYNIAIISALLGLFNLLPIPALDGGRIVLLAIEALIRRPLPRKIENWAQIISVLLLIGLTIFLLIRDGYQAIAGK